MLKPRQLQAASQLAQGISCRDVATNVGVSPQTISEWKRKPEFQAFINELRIEALNAVRTRLQCLADEACETLSHLMKSGSSDSVRLRAAVAVLDSTGLSSQSSDMFGVGIGPTSESGIRREQRENESYQRLIDQLYEN